MRHRGGSPQTPPPRTDARHTLHKVCGGQVQEQHEARGPSSPRCAARLDTHTLHKVGGGQVQEQHEARGWQPPDTPPQTLDTPYTKWVVARCRNSMRNGGMVITVARYIQNMS